MAASKTSQRLRVPCKTDDVIFHDPVSREACAATVVKVHDPGNPESAVNLTFATEEAARDKALHVPKGTGQFGTWDWPGRA